MMTLTPKPPPARSLWLLPPGVVFALACAMLFLSCGKSEKPTGSREAAAPAEQGTEKGGNSIPELNARAELAAGEGRIEEAAGDYRRAIEAARGAPPRSAEATERAKAENALGLIHFQQSSYDLAEPLFQSAIDLWRAAGREGDPAAASAMNNLAGLYKFQGKYSEAERLYARSIEIKEKVLGGADPALARGHNNLAQLYEAQGKCVEAEPHYRRALEIWENSGPENRRFATAARRSCEAIERRLREVAASAAPETNQPAPPAQASTAVRAVARDDGASSPDLTQAHP